MYIEGAPWVEGDQRGRHQKKLCSTDGEKIPIKQVLGGQKGPIKDLV